MRLLRLLLFIITLIVKAIDSSPTTTATIPITDKYQEIKQEHFMIYNDEKHALKYEEFKKDGYAQKGLNLAIVKYNDLTKLNKYWKFDKLLDDSTVKPIEIKIYSFKVQLIETICDYSKELRANLVKERQAENNIMKGCTSTNRIHQCMFNIAVSPEEKFDAKKYKFNRLNCN